MSLRSRAAANVSSVRTGIKAGRSCVGFNYAVLNRPLDLPRWRDTVDVLGVDPYPIASASNNDLAEIADWTREAYQAGDGGAAGVDG